MTWTIKRTQFDCISSAVDSSCFIHIDSWVVSSNSGKRMREWHQRLVNTSYPAMKDIACRAHICIFWGNVYWFVYLTSPEQVMCRFTFLGSLDYRYNQRLSRYMCDIKTISSWNKRQVSLVDHLSLSCSYIGYHSCDITSYWSYTNAFAYAAYCTCNGCMAIAGKASWV